MTRLLRVLMIEDSPDDALLLDVIDNQLRLESEFELPDAFAPAPAGFVAGSPLGVGSQCFRRANVHRSLITKLKMPANAMAVTLAMR